MTTAAEAHMAAAKKVLRYPALYHAHLDAHPLRLRPRFLDDIPATRLSSIGYVLMVNGAISRRNLPRCLSIVTSLQVLNAEETKPKSSASVLRVCLRKLCIYMGFHCIYMGFHQHRPTIIYQDYEAAQRAFLRHTAAGIR